MVLEEASTDTPPQESFGDGQQPGQAVRPIQYTLDFEKLPRPYMLFPLYSAKGGVAAEKNRRETSQYLVYASAVMGRPPTQDEADAVAYHLAERNATVITAVQLGSYWGLWRAYSTRNNFNWPLIDPYKKNPEFNPNKFLGLEGGQALFLRHCARLGAWTIWGLMVGHFVSDTYASIRAVRAIEADDRLQALVQRRREESEKRARAQAAGGARNRPPGTLAAPAINVNSSSSISAASVYGEEEQASARQTDQWSTNRAAAEVSDEDASPTGGLGLWDDSSDSVSKGSSWDRLRQQSTSTTSTGSASKTTCSDKDWISQEASAQQPQQQGGQGGAWDRIRQQHQQGAPQQQQQKSDDDGWWK